MEESRTRVGDRSRRVTLELPLSLEDLQHAATRHFGHNGRLRLYHKGLTPVHHERHLQKLKHDDHIVVTWKVVESNRMS